MSKWKTPLLINGAISLALFLFDLLMTSSGANDTYFPRFFVSGTLMVLLAPVNLVVGMARNRDKKSDGPAYLILSGMLLLIGFSVCTIP